MTRNLVNSHCATLPGATVDDPWGGGHDCWKVCEKMFANVGALGQGVIFKCPDIDTAAMLIDLGRAEKAPYMPRGGWVMARWGAMDEAELKERLTRSYLVVRCSLTKKLQATLPPEPGI